MLIQFGGCGDKQGKKFILAIALTANTKHCDDCTQIDRPSRIKSDRPSQQIPNTAMIVRVAIARSRIKSDRPSHQIPNTAMILPRSRLE
jgi:hypothetical protein